MLSKTNRSLKNIRYSKGSIKTAAAFAVIIWLVFVTGTGFSFSQKTPGLLYQTKMTDTIGIKIEGYLGEKMQMCIQNRIKGEDVKALTEPFKTRTETRLWQTEFWGKWMLGAVPAYQYSKDKQLLGQISASVKDIIATQTADGYIGNYADNAHLKGWDVWGRKYTLLGLLAYYDISHDKNVLTSAKKLADHLLTEVGPGKADIVKLGSFRGMPACSVLELIVKLYERTHEKKYLAFAKYIVNQWETPDGPGLISKALNGVDVADRFPHPKNWWSWENGQKAYEMMSCYQGLLELYKVTGSPEYLKVVKNAAQNIIDKEINIAGSGSAFECWYHGAQYQTKPTYHMMETCVTITWMRLCQTLLQLTHEAKYADMIEKTFYNAYLSSMSADGTSFSKYSPLEGIRGAGEDQCGMQINCCIANGPRGFALLPETILTADSNSIFVNLYTESTAVLRSKFSGNKITISQHTNYPVGDSIVIIVDPQSNEKTAY